MSPPCCWSLTFSRIIRLACRCLRVGPQPGWGPLTRAQLPSQLLPTSLPTRRRTRLRRSAMCLAAGLQRSGRRWGTKTLRLNVSSLRAMGWVADEEQYSCWMCDMCKRVVCALCSSSGPCACIGMLTVAMVNGQLGRQRVTVWLCV